MADDPRDVRVMGLMAAELERVQQAVEPQTLRQSLERTWDPRGGEPRIVDGDGRMLDYAPALQFENSDVQLDAPNQRIVITPAGGGGIGLAGPLATVIATGLPLPASGWIVFDPTAVGVLVHGTSIGENPPYCQPSPHEPTHVELVIPSDPDQPGDFSLWYDIIFVNFTVAGADRPADGLVSVRIEPDPASGQAERGESTQVVPPGGGGVKSNAYSFAFAIGNTLDVPRRYRLFVQDTSGADVPYTTTQYAQGAVRVAVLPGTVGTVPGL